MAISQERSITHPSLFLTCRLAQVVQKFKHRLRQRIQVRRKGDNPCGAPYRRGLRLRALSNLEKITTPRRASIDLPTSAVEHAQHSRWVNSLLYDLDGQTDSKIYSLTKIAANDKLLLSHSEDTLIETFAQRISLSQASYLFDLTTLLLSRLRVLRAQQTNSSLDGVEYEPEFKRLKDELFLANLIHLLRRLQYMLFQSLIRRSIQALDEYADQWREYWLQKRKLDDWFAEWPDSQPPFSATMPWNIRPSLVVLWGVCWMFYAPRAGNSDTQDAMPTQPPTGGAAMYSGWEGAFTAGETGFALETSRPSDARGNFSHADDNSLPLSEYPSSASARIYPTANHSPHMLVSQPHQTTSATVPAPLSGISGQHNPLQRQHPNQLSSGYVNNSTAWFPLHPYNNEGTALSTTDFTSRDTTWPEFSGGNYSFASSQPQQTESNPTSNVWHALQYDSAQSLFPLQTTTSVPQVTVSPVSAPPRTSHLFLDSIDAPVFPDRHFSLPTELEQQIYHQTMGVPEGATADSNYPSPHSVKDEDFDRAMSVATQSSGNPGMPAVARDVQLQTTSPSSEGSHSRNKLSIRRTQEPPKTNDGLLYCDHPECEAKPPTFRRPCEWNKHMDKHERPYKCPDPACEKIQGFTYSGGLLRHEREVHKKNVATKKLLFCPISNCNRHTGHGFTRKENLNEHMRRRHNDGSHDETQVSVNSLSPDAQQVLQFTAQSSPPSMLRKRKREEPETPTGSSSLYKIQRHDSTDSEDLREQIAKLKNEAEVKERRMQQLEETVRALSARLPPTERGLR